ncbi:HAMP domain-containing sensor histidine kinase [Georgenia phoenicis]|uniref:sensor histidine kinase n=1 Tax=unclassified Georgenia TaxID=2626815 RepID=UPI0039AFB5FC
MTARPPGPSVRLRLALSYAGLVVLAGTLLLAVVWVFLLRYVPDGTIDAGGGFVPSRSDLLAAFLPRAALAWLLLLVLGVAGGWWVAGRVLAPLGRITEVTRVAATGDLSPRVHLEGRQDEFRELADAFDAMLARLEAHVAAQRRFAANASHELRTPLATSQALLDVARTDPDYDGAALVERLRAVNSRAIAMTEALLVLSRAEEQSFAREPVDLSLLAEEATETLLPLAERRGVSLQTSGEPAIANGSPVLLLQLTTNLVHNAIVHNLPEHGRVRVAATTEGDAAVLTVESTGERLAPEVVATLTEPFQRGTERTRDGDHAGVGLGLAIVAAVARAHGGTVELTAREAGGLRVEVRLPTA